MKELLTKPVLIAIAALFCGLASLTTLLYLAGASFILAWVVVIAAGFIGALISQHMLKEQVRAQVTSLLTEAADCDAVIQTSSPLLQPVSHALNQIRLRNKKEVHKLIAQQAEQQLLIESIADGLLTINEDGIIANSNDAAQNITGYTKTQLIGAHLSTLVCDSASVSAQTFLDSFIKDSANKQHNGAAELKKADGSVFPARLSANRLASDIGHFVVLFSDISDIRSMETQLRAVNHELSKTNERLEKTSITDALTQLYNRRHFDSMFYKELQRATRSRTSLSLIIIDIDFFKQYNDIYGHTAGDDCIRRVAACIKQVFKRSGDLPSRYGGEEFAIILPGCDGLELQERAETMRHAVCELEIPHSGSKAHENLSISLGAVTYKPASQELIAPKPKELFSEADKALYRAKARGRNQVVFAGQYQPMQLPSGLGGIYSQLLSR